jgi:hypothetical protein
MQKRRKTEFPDIAAEADGAWATPLGTSIESIAFLSLASILMNLEEPVDPNRVKLAAILSAKPVLALPFLGKQTRKQWIRLVGFEAEPIHANVRVRRDDLDMAKKLNGREYGHEITPEEETEAKENNLVVVFGASDDLMEFRGAIYDEFDAWNGTVIDLYKDGLIDITPAKTMENNLDQKIEAIWDPPEYEGVSWVYLTKIPHATFDVMEDGEVYCKGIVFSLDCLD